MGRARTSNGCSLMCPIKGTTACRGLSPRTVELVAVGSVIRGADGGRIALCVRWPMAPHPHLSTKQPTTAARGTTAASIHAIWNGKPTAKTSLTAQRTATHCGIPTARRGGLTPAQQSEIVALRGTMTQTAIAARFGVSLGCIQYWLKYRATRGHGPIPDPCVCERHREALALSEQERG